ncbi:MAG: hydantoinase/oxoprolinase family protein [Candidatus Atabeyarchaeum deiterrae]
MSNRVILGWDIGGANTKASLVEFKGDKKIKIKSIIRYFPIWLEGKERLPEVLKELKEELLKGQRIDGIAVTMTAELSDAYYTKREGVNHVLDSLMIAFSDADCVIRIVDANADLRTVEEARSGYLMVAAANWSATAWLVGKRLKDTILLDTGSTTTDIIPIKGGKIVAAGRTDPERLVSGELVFTGALRTPISAIIGILTYKNKPCRVSSEKFAISADVHLVLEHITEDEYTCDTADGRSKSQKDSAARIARVICADIEMLADAEIILLAKKIYEAQLETISNALSQVADRLCITGKSRRNYPIAVAGMGRRFLAAEAARKVGFMKIIDLADVLNEQGAATAPSAAAAVMLNEYLTKKRVEMNHIP